jgi:D-serine deaminase-like pyridoxal phosphate-dependent protein
MRFRGLQGYAGQCAHVVGWAARRAASLAALEPLMETRRLIEASGLPVDIVSGASTGTYNIDSELAGLTELQAGSYCVMDLDYLRIGGRTAERFTDFDLALTVLATVVSVPTAERAIVDAGLKAFATDRPFGPEAIERPGLTYEWAGDEHGRLLIGHSTRPPALGERVEFIPPHCDPTMNLYDRLYAMRGTRVEGVWEISARGKSQ